MRLKAENHDAHFRDQVIENQVTSTLHTGYSLCSSLVFYTTMPFPGVVITMMFVATLIHPPELCLAREEYGTDSREWINSIDDRAEKLGIRVHGAYSCPTEHTFYFVLESDDFKAVTAFLSGIMLTNNMGKISPVISLKVAADTLIK